MNRIDESIKSLDFINIPQETRLNFQILRDELINLRKELNTSYPKKEVIEITNTSLLRANIANDFVLISSAGPGKIIVPYAITAYYTDTVSFFDYQDGTTASLKLSIGFKDDTTYIGNEIDVVISPNITQLIPGLSILQDNTFDISDKDLILFCEGIDPANGSDGAGSLKVTVFYEIIEL